MYKAFDIVRVPFPFTDRQRKKTRPALILSSQKHFNDESEQSVAAMITSAKHSRFPLDVIISNVEKAGLPQSCLIRMKLFTIDHRLVIEKVGQLDKADKIKVTQAAKKLFQDIL